MAEQRDISTFDRLIQEIASRLEDEKSFKLVLSSKCT